MALESTVELAPSPEMVKTRGVYTKSDTLQANKGWYFYRFDGWGAMVVTTADKYGYRTARRNRADFLSATLPRATRTTLRSAGIFPGRRMLFRQDSGRRSQR